MLRCAILTIFSILALSLSVFAEAQSRYPAQVNSVKDDGRFIAKLGIGGDIPTTSLGGGFVRHLDIEFEWWGFIGQAVEIYGIRWERGSSYNLGGVTLSRSSLGKYPDLVDRFDDLKPINIEVSFHVEMFSEGHENGRKYDRSLHDSYGATYYRDGRVSAKKITDNFLIAESGKMMRDLVPSSPLVWQSFIDISSYHDTLNGDQNAKTQNTFKAAQKIVFKNLRITKIDLPDASARAIYDEYQKREKEEKDCEEKNTCDEEEGTSKDKDKQDDDIWAESNYKESDSNSTGDDIWAESNYSDAKSTSTSSDIWSGESINRAKRAKEAELKRKKEACEKRSLKVWDGDACIDYVPVKHPNIVLYRTYVD